MTGKLLASIECEVRGWSGVWKKWDENGLGGVELTGYRFGGSPIKHAHDDGVADFQLPKAPYDELIRDGRAKSHPVGFANIVSYYVREPEGVPGAVKLFRMNYERLRAHESRG
jgi:hypothetical protein